MTKPKPFTDTPKTHCPADNQPGGCQDDTCRLHHEQDDDVRYQLIEHGQIAECWSVLSDMIEQMRDCHAEDPFGPDAKVKDLAAKKTIPALVFIGQFC